MRGYKAPQTAAQQALHTLSPARRLELLDQILGTVEAGLDDDDPNPGAAEGNGWEAIVSAFKQAGVALPKPRLDRDDEDDEDDQWAR